MNGLLRAKWLRGALIALLLLAQHGALTHALMHAGRLAQGHTAHLSVSHTQLAPADHDHGHDNRVRQATESCTFDLVYSQVLGGVHAGHVVTYTAAEQVLVVTATLAVRNSVTVVPYDSRGPPVIS
ncbi:MAG: hypothetical protein OEV67_13045 [Betaproteobacteria bacterium]|nr:hypothetical protein [Betaproteobacteria bacterium]